MLLVPPHNSNPSLPNTHRHNISKFGKEYPAGYIYRFTDLILTHRSDTQTTQKHVHTHNHARSTLRQLQIRPYMHYFIHWTRKNWDSIKSSFKFYVLLKINSERCYILWSAYGVYVETSCRVRKYFAWVVNLWLGVTWLNDTQSPYLVRFSPHFSVSRVWGVTR